MSYLVRRGGIYHFRCRVPADLLSVVGRCELTHSLRTACPRQARELAADAYAAACNQFHELRMTKKRPPMIAAIDDDQVGEPVAARKPASRFTADYLAKQVSISSQVAINSLTRDLDTLKKSENVGRQADAMAEIRGMLSDMGVRVKNTVTPTVLDFLRDEYSTEKKLQDDARRHVENYVTLFARITGNKTVSEYTRTDIQVTVPKESPVSQRPFTTLRGAESLGQGFDAKGLVYATLNVGAGLSVIAEFHREF